MRLGSQRYHKQSRSALTRSSNSLLRKVHWKTDCAHGAYVNASKEREKEREAVAVSCALIITAYMKTEAPHDSIGSSRCSLIRAQQFLSARTRELVFCFLGAGNRHIFAQTIVSVWWENAFDAVWFYFLVSKTNL